MSERSEMRLVRNEDGSWRSWDNSIDDCMDSSESMLVREVLPGDIEIIYDTPQEREKLVQELLDAIDGCVGLSIDDEWRKVNEAREALR